MFRIGDFSRIARVSARLLRFYDEIGLLAPAQADRQTGYRYYTVAQLAQLNRITVLKELGFSLEQIGDMLKAPPQADELRRLLLLRRNDVERTLDQEAQRLRNIETRIAQIESEGSLSSDDVVERAEPARRLLSVRRQVASFAEARVRLRGRATRPRGATQGLGARAARAARGAAHGGVRARRPARRRAPRHSEDRPLRRGQRRRARWAEPRGVPAAARPAAHARVGGRDAIPGAAAPWPRHQGAVTAPAAA
jgi:DNA-binding transcriptional MerR regulator